MLKALLGLLRHSGVRRGLALLAALLLHEWVRSRRAAAHAAVRRAAREVLLAQGDARVAATIAGLRVTLKAAESAARDADAAYTSSRNARTAARIAAGQSGVGNVMASDRPTLAVEASRLGV